MTAVDIIKNVVGRRPRKVANEKVRFFFQSKESLVIEYNGVSKEFQLFDTTWFDINDEEFENPLFETKQLMIFPDFEEQNECEDCHGEGYTEEFIGCSRPASECCGGCTANVICECENRFYSL